MDSSTALSTANYFTFFHNRSGWTKAITWLASGAITIGIQLSVYAQWARAVALLWWWWSTWWWNSQSNTHANNDDNKCKKLHGFLMDLFLFDENFRWKIYFWLCIWLNIEIFEWVISGLNGSFIYEILRCFSIE